LTKPTYYLLQDNYPSLKEYQNAKERYTRMGFRVVTFKGGQNNLDIQQGIKSVIKNHIVDFYN